MRLSTKPLFLFLFSSFCWIPLSHGAACCGGGFAAPSIITGDDKAQMTSSLSYSEVAVDNVNSSGVWKKWNDHQQTQTLRIEGAHIFSDRWQAGFSIPIIQRTKLDKKYSGLGDLSTSLGYEYLPDWTYSPYRPKGVGYLQLTLPTGKSRAESEIGGLDSRGNGLWAVGFGTILTKTIGRWDVFSSLEIHRSFDKSISTSQIQGTLKPGLGGNFGIGGGYNTSFWRFGGSATWTHEDPIDIKGPSKIDGSVETYATAVASASYLLSSEWAGTLSYSDQTILGNPTNTSLARSIALVFQKRWLR